MKLRVRVSHNYGYKIRYNGLINLQNKSRNFELSKFWIVGLYVSFDSISIVIWTLTINNW